MIIHLNEIPAEGKTWSLSRGNSKLNNSFQDLVGDNDFKIEFSIRPLENTGTYDLQGQVETELPEECSRCSLEFKHPIKQRFRHILVPAMPLGRTDHESKPNHFSDTHMPSQIDDTGPEAIEFSENSFHAGDFLHETIALAAPFIPAPPVDKDGNCGLCKIDVKTHNFGYDEDMGKPANPFVGLKGIKLN